MKLKNNPNIVDLTDKCTNCGNCRLICPVFNIKKEELYSTRGRINLIRGLMNNELEPNRDTIDKIYACLNCRQCAAFCPADVEYSLIIKKTKASIKISKNLFSIKNYIMGMLFSSKPEVSDAAFKVYGFIERHLFRPRKLKFFRYIILKILKISASAEFPELPERNFFRMGNRTRITTYKGFRVALFLGCGGKYIYPQTADRFVRMLRSNGIQVLIPKDQVCSGNALEHRGMVKEASKNIKKNISVFNSMIDIRYITSICSNDEKDIGSAYGGGSSEGFRIDYINWIKLTLDNGLTVKPALNDSIIFHCCPKCSTKELAAGFMEKLYSDHPYKPKLTTDFCGATELFDRSNQDIRDHVMKAFFENNSLDKYKSIACSSFECVEHMNEYFSRNNKSIKAVHFVDAVDI